MNRDFVEMLSALCDAEAEFLIVGALAMRTSRSWKAADAEM